MEDQREGERPAALRLVTSNFWGIEAPLERRLALAKKQLGALAPDVICMQEVRPMDGRAGRTTADDLADVLEYQRVYAVSLRWNDDDFYPGHAGGEEGLAVLSRYSIIEHRVTRLPEARATEARILLSACVDTPAGPVWCHTTHLHYRLDDGLAREKQVVAIDGVVKAISLECAPGAVQIVCGDFNATPDSDEIRFMHGLTTLAGRRTHYQDAYARIHAGERGITWSSENDHTRPLRSLDIDRRIDYVFVTTRRKDGRGTILDARVVLDERDSAEHDPGVCASDHYGVLADVQIAPGPATGQ